MCRYNLKGKSKTLKPTLIRHFSKNKQFTIYRLFFKILFLFNRKLSKNLTILRRREHDYILNEIDYK